ncbi:hypothetical protein KKC45_01560 [Patescibacteria group bacterium]|nr:hypothetical protein [Patescibacteria group bacterium]
MTKTTKTAIIIFSIFIIFVLGLVIFYFYIIKSDNQVDDFEEFKDTYIFGRPTSEVVGGDSIGLATSSQEIIDLGESVNIPKLRKITDSPIAGFVSFEDKNDVVSVRYIEKATGHVYEARMNSLTKKRVSNTTIPRVQESVWVDKDSVIIRYLDENNNIKTFSAEIAEADEGELTDGKIEGVFLSDNMKEVISLGKNIFYLLEGTNGSQGFVSSLDGETVSKIFDSPLKEWLIQRPKQGTLTLTMKPSSDVFSYLYFLNTDTGRMDKKLSEKGLTTLTNKNLSNVLFSKSLVGDFSLSVYDILNKEIRTLPLNTLSEKCVWGDNNTDIYCGIPNSVTRGDYPDEWYQGLISFSDNVYRLDTETGSNELLVSPREVAREDIDIIEPTLSSDENYLFFINKKDFSFWSLELK